MAEDPKKAEKPTLKNWDGMVQKADGSVGKWGNEIKPQRYKAAVRLYPKGEVEKSKIDSLVKAGRGNLIGQPMKKPGQVAQYGEAASDIIKKLVKSK